MKLRMMRLSATALLVAVALITVACGQSGSGSQGSGSQSGDSPQGGSPSGGETTGGMSGMDMESTGGMVGTDNGEMSGMDMGSEEMARQMLTEGGGYSDENFIDQMVPHHRGAIEEGEVALENAEHEELRNLAEGIIAEQRTEIDLMRDIKQEEYGTREVPMQMSSEEMEAMGMMEDPEALAEEDPFDRAFMNNMIPHHQSAIAMAEVALDESENPEIRELARNIIESQRAEIEQMRGWLGEWYPEDG
ncbi:MAG: DUF305 domain-containing protein [Rubrobacter sp.]|nr:DUF305 domain-containing protein [Rubrobacter sp.]